MNKIDLMWNEIKLLILDVDGVLTDGRLYYGNDGETLKVFHVRDGQGIVNLLANNVNVAVISGKGGSFCEKRLRELGIVNIYLNVKDKIAAYEDLKSKLKIHEKNTAYIGDDIGDILLLKRVKFGITVSDAHISAKNIASYITNLPGGNGAVREIADLILNAQSN